MRCTAAIDTVIGIIECERDDGRHHTPPHHFDDVRDGEMFARFVWYDDRAGYGAIPASRLDR